MSDERPSLGDIKVGDKVRIRTRGSRFEKDEEAVVTKIARIWITVETEIRSYRFRKDTQTADDRTWGLADYFETLEQYAWSQRDQAAWKFLREQRIDAFTGPWAKRRLELANLIRRHEGLEEL